jgi:hypothetical protein
MLCGRCLFVVSSLEEQVVADEGSMAGGLVCVEVPAVLLPLLNRPADILVMIDLHTFPFFQLNLTSSVLSS